MASIILHEREQDDEHVERYSKRCKLDEAQGLQPMDELAEEPVEAHSEPEHILPPSHALLGIPLPVADEDKAMNLMETDVGISEYIGVGVPKIEGIIKQRFTDFLVHEIDLDGHVIHIKSLEQPVSSKYLPAPQVESSSQTEDNVVGQEPGSKLYTESQEVDEDTPQRGEAEIASQNQIIDDQPWPEQFTATLSPFLSGDVIQGIKHLYLAGPNPPRATDNGWATRASRSEAPSDGTHVASESAQQDGVNVAGEKRGKKRGSRGGRRGGAKEDTRRVLSGPITSKETRTALHQAIRDLFSGKLDSETDASTPASEDGSRVIIRWARRGNSRGTGRSGRSDAARERPSRGAYPPYIHFTLQKTNRDNQDALGHLARALHVSAKDLSVAGTKDKRGVTVQRVSLKRGSKTVEDVWNLVNRRRHTLTEAVTERGERGIRIADLNYRKASLELGMLKGNAFLITLRSVKTDSEKTLHTAMNNIKTRGFINYYGMQRFGTASVPTHSIGLALLKSEWQKAISLILRKRHGEHPDVGRARDAWLVDENLDKALELMPRRVVAERCILESYKKQRGDTRNAMGALSTIPRNLRLMYIHAYQSYVWNAIVSQRIRVYGADKPVVGDLVFEREVVSDKVTPDGNSDTEGRADAEAETKGPSFATTTSFQSSPDDDSSNFRKRSRKPYTAPRVKTLTEEDLPNYSIFDVIMPLPGTDVAYPGGLLGKKYREYLQMDGLDPDNFVRKQRDYTLNGSYRAILHLPKGLSWSILRYTDPDVALAQADEDKLLGFDPPNVDDDGKFMALQINITLGTAAYATMALREITKTETSSHFQTGLTSASEDQQYRGKASGAAADEEIDETTTMAVNDDTYMDT